jgi:hypothetical protein
VGPSARRAARTTKPGLPKASARPAPLHLTNQPYQPPSARTRVFVKCLVKCNVFALINVQQSTGSSTVLYSLNWCYLGVTVLYVLSTYSLLSRHDCLVATSAALSSPF